MCATIRQSSLLTDPELVPNSWSYHREKLLVMKSTNYKRPTSSRTKKRVQISSNLFIIARARSCLHSFGCIRMIQGMLTPCWLFSQIACLPLSILPLRMHHLYPSYWLIWSIYFHNSLTHSLLPFFTRDLAWIKSERIVSIAILPMSCQACAGDKLLLQQW